MEIIKLARRGQFIFKTYFSSFKGTKRYSFIPKDPLHHKINQHKYKIQSKMNTEELAQHNEELPLEDPDEVMLQDQEKKMKTISKKGITFSNFKMHKKLAQGIKVLCKIEEKKFGDMVTQTPTKNLLILHFGSGDEEDYNGLSKFIESFGKFTLHIFPGIPYGLVEFESIQQADELIKSSTKVPDNIVANSCEVNFGQKVRNVFFFNTNLGITNLQRQKQTDIPDGSTSTKVPGLEIIPDFVTPEEEQELMKEIDKNKWNPLAQRRVQHYGYEFIYGANSVNKNKYIGPLPDFIPNITSRINQVGQKNNKLDFDQLTINDYFPGQGIPPHVDTHSPFEECLVSLSLGSGVVMSFKDEKNVSKHVFLPPRSLAVFTQEARYAFYHSIATRKLDRVDGALFFRRRRISLTYRKVKHDECHCKWPIFCDSQSTKPLPAFQEFKKEDKEGHDAEPEEIEVEEGIEEHKASDKTQLSDWEKKYVYGTYEKIAPHFSSTRYKPWPKIAKFLTDLPFGSVVADVGCGNGKYLPVNQENLYTIGTDRAENFMEICKQRDPSCQVFSADSLRLPFRTECVDYAISVAVIHHFSNRKLRIQAIKELARITRKGGKILIYVWAFEQDGKKFTQQDVLVPWHLQYKWEDSEKLSNLLGDKTEAGSNVGEGSQKGDKSEVSEKEEEKKEEKKDESIREGSVKEGEEECHVNEVKKTVVYKRYYHMFKNGELEDLIKEVPEVEIEESFYDHANWCVKLRKVGN